MLEWNFFTNFSPTPKFHYFLRQVAQTFLRLHFHPIWSYRSHRVKIHFHSNWNFEFTLTVMSRLNPSENPLEKQVCNFAWRIVRGHSFMIDSTSFRQGMRRFLGSGCKFYLRCPSYKWDIFSVFWPLKNLLGAPGIGLVLLTPFLRLRFENNSSR